MLGKLLAGSYNGGVKLVLWVLLLFSAHSPTMATPIKLASEALKKVQLECSICLQPYTEPKLLSCFHICCKACLNQVVVKSRDQSCAICPQCRRSTPLQQSGVAGLQSAFHVHHLFEIRDTLEKVKEPQSVHCDNQKCNKATAIGYCRECGKFVCERCTAAHEIFNEVASHQIVSIADVQADSTSLVPISKRKVMHCPRHPENPLKIYCETCQELVCVDCTIRHHKHHQYDLVTDVFPKHRDEILAQLKPVRQHLETINTALGGALDTQEIEIGDQRQAIEADIHRRIDQLKQILDLRRAELVGQLDQLTQQKLKNLAAQRDQMELLQTQLSSCLEYVEGSLKTGTMGEILAMKAAVVRQIQQMVPGTLQPHERADMLLLEDDTPRLTEACRTFATLTTPSDPTQCYATGDGLKTATVGDRAEVTLHTRNKDGSECFVPTAHITAELVSIRDNTEVKCQVTAGKSNKHLIVYQPDTRGKHHLHITIGKRQTRDSPHTVVVRPRLGKPVKVVGELKIPWGVTTNSKGMVIVVETGANCVSVCTPEGEKVQSFGSEGKGNGQFDYPCGVTVDGDDNIYVVDSNNHRIQKFTPNGEHIASVGSYGGNKLQFQYPVGIGFNHTNNKIYVSDQYNNRVQILDTKLATSKVFSAEGSANGQIKLPWDVAFDSDGNAYIADSDNHRIQVFSSEGQYLRKFGSQGSGRGQLSGPSSVAIDKDRVYVVEYGNHRVSIFTTAGQFLHCFGNEGQEQGQLNEPWGIAVDDNGFVLVSDSENNRIQFF